MAEAPLSLGSFKKEFEDQLTCGVCLDHYTDPKMLPCGHIFCLKCIQLLPATRKVSTSVKKNLYCIIFNGTTGREGLHELSNMSC